MKSHEIDKRGEKEEGDVFFKGD